MAYTSFRNTLATTGGYHERMDNSIVGDKSLFHTCIRAASTGSAAEGMRQAVMVYVMDSLSGAPLRTYNITRSNSTTLSSYAITTPAVTKCRSIDGKRALVVDSGPDGTTTFWVSVCYL